jgi:hypothetical protein
MCRLQETSIIEVKFINWWNHRFTRPLGVKKVAKQVEKTDYAEHKLVTGKKVKKGGKQMNVKSKPALVLIGLVMMWPFLAAAQEKPAGNMQFVVEKIRADKKLFISENMQLTEAEAKAFWPVYEDYQNELFLIRTRTLRLIDNYAEAYEKMTSDTAKKLLEEYMTIENLWPKLRQTYLPRFREALPDVKVVRYYQLENKINAALIYGLAGKIPLIKEGK